MYAIMIKNLDEEVIWRCGSNHFKK